MAHERRRFWHAALLPDERLEDRAFQQEMRCALLPDDRLVQLKARQQRYKTKSKRRRMKFRTNQLRRMCSLKNISDKSRNS